MSVPDWNVVATVYEGGYRKTRRFLAPFGPIARTTYFNVMVMRVEDREGFLAAVSAAVDNEPGLLNFLSRLVPCAAAFSFQTAAEFEQQAREIVLPWTPRLAGKSFHVRLHRRGFKGKLSSPEEERFLDDALLAALSAAGTPGRIAFENPDAVILIETVDNRAGIALFTRDELARYPFLRPERS
ncbi:MAG: THUMP domain-containing protein [Alphaproteobacteria bacterium]